MVCYIKKKGLSCLLQLWRERERKVERKREKEREKDSERERDHLILFYLGLALSTNELHSPIQTLSSSHLEAQWMTQVWSLIATGCLYIALNQSICWIPLPLYRTHLFPCLHPCPQTSSTLLPPPPAHRLAPPSCLHPLLSCHPHPSSLIYPFCPLSLFNQLRQINSRRDQCCSTGSNVKEPTFVSARASQTLLRTSTI